MEVLSQPFQIPFVEELHLDVRIPLAELPQLAVLARDERLLHDGQLDVEILVGEVEVGRERLEHAALRVLLEDEGPRLVLPRDAVIVEDLRALELRLAREARRLGPTIGLENRGIEPHLFVKVPTGSDGGTALRL